MLNINDTLNNVIAVVVVILILSLVVQSVQSVLKKLFKIKSRQIEESLVDLFTNVLNKPAFRPKNRLDKLIDHTPMWRIIFFWRPSPERQAEVEDIYKGVMDGFRDIGRLSQSGKQMLDSIAKEDLLKVLEKVPIKSILPSSVEGVTTAFAQIRSLEQDIQKIKNAVLDGDARHQFAVIKDTYESIEVLLRPLFNDVQSIIDTRRVAVRESPPAEELQGGIAALELLVRDMMVLRNINIVEVQKLLDEMQKPVAGALTTVGPGTAAATALGVLAMGLSSMRNTIAAVRRRLDPAVAAFEAKARETGIWHDIVMQSFEERYNRSMKTWAVVIAFLVVALLNANFFNIYRNIATSEVTRDLLVEKGGDVLKLSRDRTAAERVPATQPPTQPLTQPVTQPAAQPATKPGTQSTIKPLTQPVTQPATQPVTQPVTQSATQPATQPADGSTKPATEEKQQTKENLNEAIQLVKSDANLYEGIGFAPLKWQQVKDWFGSLTPDTKTDQPWGLWWESRKHDVTVLLGWIVMTMLLSIGAPFWQDTLESLFGVKNLLRKKGNIKNVESESGAGQPKT